MSSAKARRARNMAWFRALMAQKSCEECGASHPAILDWHHKDPALKDFTITTAIRKGWSVEKVVVEMAKCRVLCSNCHRKLHWEETHDDESDSGSWPAELLPAA